MAIPYVSTLTGMQLLSAVKVKVTDIQEITCPYCNGDGNTPLTKTCSQCQGTGTIECTLCEATGFVTEGLVATPGQNGINFTLIAWALIAVVAVLGISFTGFVLIKKRRISEKSLRNLSNGEFQTWVLKRLDAKNSTSTDTSQGIDGYSPIDQPIQIKQSDNVGMSVIDLFTSSVARKRASSGIIVAFSFSDDAIRSKIRARRSLNIDLEMITVRELIENRKMY
jgi:hypothetical protein